MTKEALEALERYTRVGWQNFDDYKIIKAALICSAQVDAPIPTYTAKYTDLCKRLRQPVDQGGYDGYAKDPWYCGIADKIEQLEIDLGTQMTMHGAWRKRAEQSEAEFIQLKAQVDGLVKIPLSASTSGDYIAPDYIKGWNAAVEALAQFTAKEKTP